MQNASNVDKVGLIGTGMVGASFAYALLQRGLVGEMVLIDADHQRAEGEAMDLNHGVPFVRPVKVRAGSYEDLDGASLVVITAGANQKPGQTRLDLLKHNAGVIRDIVPKIVAASPEARIIIATNPVDILTTIAADISGLPHGRVLGSGTILDTARFRYLLGEMYGVDARSVHAYIIGEHGDTAVPVWSLASLAGVPLAKIPRADGRPHDPADWQTVFERTRDAAYEIISRKRATYYAIGLGLLTLVEAILRDQHSMLTVSVPLDGQHGVTGLATSLPCIVGKNGVERILDIPLDPEETRLFRHSSDVLKERLAQL